MMVVTMMMITIGMPGVLHVQKVPMNMFVKTSSQQYNDNDEYGSYIDDSNHYVMMKITMMIKRIMAMMIMMVITMMKMMLDMSEVWQYI